MSNVEHTFALIKAHAIGHAAEIILRATRAGLVLYRPSHNYRKFTLEDAEFLYAEHAGRPYMGDLIKSVTKDSVAVYVLSGVNAVTRWRRLLGATDPEKAVPGCIRGDFGTILPDNAAHGSDSVKSAIREIRRFVPEYKLPN